MEQADFKYIQDIRFSHYLLDLEKLKTDDLQNLDILVEKYPYCQIIHFLAAKAAEGTPQYKNKLARAAGIAPSRNILYDVIHHPDKFKADENNHAEVIEQKPEYEETIISVIEEEPVLPEITETETEEEPVLSEITEADTEEEPVLVQEEIFEVEDTEQAEEPILAQEEVSEIEATEPEEDLTFNLQPDSFEANSIENLDLDGERFSETLIEQQEEVLTEDQQTEEEHSIVSAEQEEIAQQNEIDSPTEEEPLHIEEETTEEPIALEPETEETFATELQEEEQEIPEVAFQEIKTSDYVENIIDEDFDASDFHAEESTFSFTSLAVDEAEAPTAPVIEEQNPVIQSQALAINPLSNITPYNDDRLPYTFLWWLSKTRKDHENTRPFATFELDTTDEIKNNDIDALNHQIAENIFHLKSTEEISGQTSSFTVPFNLLKKEHQIIEKFIKEEPQIKPPAPHKIDTENKAKKSSEDTHELVSETLAKVYVEQMLFHKALEVYKKLSLKYPEKSTYFASQIKYLELKVN